MLESSDWWRSNFEPFLLALGLILVLIGRGWIETVATWPEEFVYMDMVETGIDLSNRLRDPLGDYRCDLIIALTHSRLVHTS